MHHQQPDHHDGPGPHGGEAHHEPGGGPQGDREDRPGHDRRAARHARDSLAQRQGVAPHLDERADDEPHRRERQGEAQRPLEELEVPSSGPGR